MKTNKVVLALIACLMLAITYGMSLAENKTGVLSVISTNNTSKVYIDGSFEGTGSLLLNNIIAGNHLVQVKDNDSKIVYEEMSLVKEGEQTTVYADNATKTQTSNEQNTSVMSKDNLGIDFTYGYWTTIVNVSGSTTRAQSTDPIKVLGIYWKNINDKNVALKMGYNYVFNPSGGSSNGSFVTLDYGIQNDFIEASIGSNYSFPTMDGATNQTGGLGYQMTLGVKLPYYIIGAKYLFLTGSGDFVVGSTTYRVNVSYSQFIAYISIDLPPFQKITTKTTVKPLS